MASTALGRDGSRCHKKCGRASRSAACIAATRAAGMARSVRSTESGSARADASLTRTEKAVQSSQRSKGRRSPSAMMTYDLGTSRLSAAELCVQTL